MSEPIENVRDPITCRRARSAKQGVLARERAARLLQQTTFVAAAEQHTGVAHLIYRTNYHVVRVEIVTGNEQHASRVCAWEFIGVAAPAL